MELPYCVGLPEAAALKTLQPLGIVVLKRYFSSRKELPDTDTGVVVRQRLLEGENGATVELMIARFKRTL